MLVRPLFLCEAHMSDREDIPDPIEAVKSGGFKWCTHCGVRKELDAFHQDSAKEDGRRDTCKECRSKIDKERKQKTLDAELQKVEQEGLKALGNLSSGGSFDPHINEVFESLMKPFGGVNGWAKHLFATYLACDPGSQKRVKIHDMMMQLAGKVTKLGLAERQLDMMEERDLLQVMRQHLVEYQENNELPSTAIPTLTDQVIDADQVEVKGE